MKFSEQGVITEEALLAYANNQLSSEEKQEFEKLLKDDPFAREALEGLQKANQSVTPQTISGIRKKVRERIGMKESRVIQLHWTNYAWAAVVLGLLIGIGFIMINYVGNKDEHIAMTGTGKNQPENILEQKKEETKLVPLGGVADSVIVAQPQGITIESKSNESPLQDKSKTESDKQMAEKKPDADNKNSKEINISNQQKPTTPPVTTTATNSTIVANLNGIGTAQPSAGAVQNVATAPQTRAEEGLGKDNRTADMDMEKENKAEVQKIGEAKSAHTQRSIAAEPPKTVETESLRKNKNATTSMDDAMQSFNNGDYKKASGQFDDILKRQPDNNDALYFGGVSAYLDNDTKKSERNFDSLLKGGHWYVDGSKWYKANILLKKGKRDEAAKLLDELSQSNGSYKERAIKKKAEF